jgi:hypothetical protein
MILVFLALTMYLPNMHLPFIYNGQYAIVELLDTCKEYGASFVWIYRIGVDPTGAGGAVAPQSKY